MSLTLSPLQRRVLGVLIEKSLAQPDYYPMTLNSITSACNQKQNRDPVMECTEGEVARTIRELEEMKLAGVAASAPGARANRFEHRAAAKLDWDRPQRAIMAELLLRGPQTIGELRGRASRMAAFESTPIVGNVLQSLAEHDPPWVAELPREPGKSATRWSHLLSPESEAPALRTAREPAEPPTAAAAGPPTAELEQRITRLEATVQAVQEKLARLEAKVTSRLP